MRCVGFESCSLQKLKLKSVESRCDGEEEEEEKNKWAGKVNKKGTRSQTLMSFRCRAQQCDTVSS